VKCASRCPVGTAVAYQADPAWYAVAAVSWAPPVTSDAEPFTTQPAPGAGTAWDANPTPDNPSATEPPDDPTPHDPDNNPTDCGVNDTGTDTDPAGLITDPTGNDDNNPVKLPDGGDDDDTVNADPPELPTTKPPERRPPTNVSRNTVEPGDNDTTPGATDDPVNPTVTEPPSLDTCT